MLPITSCERFTGFFGYPEAASSGSQLLLRNIIFFCLDEDDDNEEEDDDDESDEDESETTLVAPLSGDGVETGKAEFELEVEGDETELELEVEIEDAEPGSVHDVSVDGVVIGSIEVDDSGHGELELSSEDGDDVAIPEVSADSTVNVGSILSGQFVDISDMVDVNGDDTLDAGDVDMVFAAARAATPDPAYDLDQSGSVDKNDAATLLDVLDAAPGDVNLDGVFDSSDLVAIFAAAEFEDGVTGNSVWSTGDWNGDGEFDTSDLVFAFQSGRYFGA